MLEDLHPATVGIIQSETNDLPDFVQLALSIVVLEVKIFSYTVEQISTVLPRVVYAEDISLRSEQRWTTETYKEHSQQEVHLYQLFLFLDSNCR